MKNNIKRISGSVMLPGTNGLRARWTVERYGQEPPSQGDRVVAVGRLELPADGIMLADCLRFGDRADPVMGRRLGAYWSTQADMCARSEGFTATTWGEAFDAARAAVLSAAYVVRDACAARREALRAAGRVTP